LPRKLRKTASSLDPASFTVDLYEQNRTTRLSSSYIRETVIP
jgi:hypothetical protein